MSIYTYKHCIILCLFIYLFFHFYNYDSEIRSMNMFYLTKRVQVKLYYNIMVVLNVDYSK